MERWFRELTEKSIRRGSFYSVEELIVAIEEEIGIELTPEVIGEHPTIARLSTYLAALCAARETEA